MRSTSVEIALEVLALKAGRVPPEIVVRQIFRGFGSGRQEPAPERTVGDEADAQLAARRKQPVLGIAREQRVLGLERGDRMHGVRAANRRRAASRQADVADLPCRDQLAIAPTVSSIGVFGSTRC